jgi:hypothetical protein
VKDPYFCSMNWNYEHLIPKEFSPLSKVWIYQSNRLFTLQEALELERLVDDFVTNWQSHGTPVKGYGNLLFGQFIVLMADETATGVSGCSTDSSVRLIKKIEELFNVQLFNRQLLAFLINDKIQILPLAQVPYAIEQGYVTGDTMFFNNLVQTKDELLNKWVIPVKDSWLKSKLALGV